MDKNLDRIEHHLRTLFEEHLVKLIIGRKNQLNLIDDLVNAMRKNLRDNPDGGIVAPDRFVVHIPNEDSEDWVFHQDTLNEIARSLALLGASEGFQFIEQPSIILHEDPSASRGEYFVTATESPKTKPVMDATGMTKPEPFENGSILPNDASFIIGGKDNFRLDKPVINIGRHSDNDLSLEDPHISRHHAQLRAINQRFVIFDVGSTSGIYLNGRKIIQSTLQTGDVIRIGMTNLIYIQDTTSSSETRTMPADHDNHPHESNSL
jgi:hypothetical protein